MTHSTFFSIRQAICILWLFSSAFYSSSSFSKAAPIDMTPSWQPLLDAQLSQWEGYLSYKHKIGYSGAIPTDTLGKPISPIGLLADPQEHGVFTIQENEVANLSPTSGPVLKVSGEIYGGLSTKREYENYHLKLKFKWGEKVFEPRLALLKDSGVLYHATGEQGQDYWRSWMVSQEFQIMRGHVGDYWNLNNTAIDVRAFTPEYIMNPVADETQPYVSVGKNEAVKGFVLRKENVEKDEGEWNELELICFGDQSLHIVNGVVVMVLKNSRIIGEDGSSMSLVKGKIQLQSEAAEVYFKDIMIRDITAIPAQYSALH